jgi:hypothetical protein
MGSCWPPRLRLREAAGPMSSSIRCLAAIPPCWILCCKAKGRKDPRDRPVRPGRQARKVPLERREPRD